jgi:hypothetical protein
MSMMLFFWVLSLSSGLNMETVCFSETLASTDESTRRQNPQEHHHHHHHPHRRDNLKSNIEMPPAISVITIHIQIIIT